MGTAVDRSIVFQPVPDDPNPTGSARRRQDMDGAFETVEGVGLACLREFERLVVVVAACVAFGHGDAPGIPLDRALTPRTAVGCPTRSALVLVSSNAGDKQDDQDRYWTQDQYPMPD